jgi:hypothetical protein
MSRMFLGEKNKGCKIVKRRKIIISIPDSHFQKKKTYSVLFQFCDGLQVLLSQKFSRCGYYRVIDVLNKTVNFKIGTA